MPIYLDCSANEIPREMRSELVRAYELCLNRNSGEDIARNIPSCLLMEAAEDSGPAVERLKILQ